MQKLYCYVDETGQDTEGAFFLVVVLVILKNGAARLEQRLNQIEHESGKHALKWHKSRPRRRQAYLRRIFGLEELRGCIFYSTFTESQDYTTLTAQVLVKAIRIQAAAPYQATIFIDGLNEAERDRVRRLLKRARVSYRAIRGLRDESSSLIRLCDALAGLLRDYEENEAYAKPLMAELQKRGILKKV